MTKPVQPTVRDRQNFAARTVIAQRERRDYGLALAFALGLFGAGFEPHGRHYLVDSEEASRLRYAREWPDPAATVYSARKGAEERFWVVEDGKAREVAGIKQGFGAMLSERHPTKRIAVKGGEIAPARYELCWGWFDGSYKPRSAEALAVARGKRIEKAEEKKQAELDSLANSSLFPEWLREQAEEKKRGR